MPLETYCACVEKNCRYAAGFSMPNTNGNTVFVKSFLAKLKSSFEAGTNKYL